VFHTQANDFLEFHLANEKQNNNQMNCNQNTKALIYNDYLSFLLYQEGQNLPRIAISCPDLFPCLWSYHKNIVGVGSPPPEGTITNSKSEISRSQTVLTNSPPLEGCPQGGVVNSKSLDYPENCPNKNISVSNSRYSSNIPEFLHNLYIAGNQPSQKWFKYHYSNSLNIRISALQYTPKINQ
jgi:hypothetical protein